MEVDTNELLRRIGAVLRGISDKMDRLVRIVESLEGQVRLPSAHETDHFAGADKMVADEPAKKPEAEHPAGPMPDPGEGYRLLSKDPPEDLQPGDDYDVAGVWVTSAHARTHKIQHENTWYRRKIETPKPAEPEYREPVLPADAGKECEFSDDGRNWRTDTLVGFSSNANMAPWEAENCWLWEYARIKVNT